MGARGAKKRGRQARDRAGLGRRMGVGGRAGCIGKCERYPGLPCGGESARAVRIGGGLALFAAFNPPPQSSLRSRLDSRDELQIASF